MKRRVAGISERDVMKLPRRQFLQLAAGAAALPAVSRVAWAQAYPSRPVRLVVGYAPGGAGDISMRLLGQWLSERFGQQFIVENRTGAGTNIATESVVRAAADGYTLLLSSAANAINATLYDRLNFNFIHDTTPISGILRVPHVIVVHPSFSAKTLPEFIAYAKANPGKLTWASPGVGTAGHVWGELFKMMAGLNMVHVPYRGGGAAMADLLSGQLQVYIGAMTSSLEYVKANRLRALAVSTATRSEALPEVARVSEFVPGFETSDWGGVSAPKSTPGDIVDKLNKEINTALADPKFKARLADLGAAPFPGSPAQFGTFIAEETEKWAKVVKFAGIKAE
jgi:tripartite-type tricarboxylate transporter receptor subunit TctC